MSKSFDKFAADPKNYSSAEEATVPSTFVSDPNVFDFSLQQQHEKSSRIFSNLVNFAGSLGVSLFTAPLTTTHISMQLAIKAHRNTMMESFTAEQMLKGLPADLPPQDRTRFEMLITCGATGTKKPYHAPVYLNYREVFQGLAKQGFLGFYKGNFLGVLHIALTSTVKANAFYYMDHSKVLSGYTNNFGLEFATTTGVLTLIDILMNPLQVAQSRFVLQNRLPNFYTYKNLLDFFGQHIRNPRTFFLGWTCHLPKNLLTTVSSVNLFKDNPIYGYLVSNYIAEALTYPVLTILRRLQCQDKDAPRMLIPRYTGIVNAAQVIAKEEGVRGFYRGFLAFMAIKLFASSLFLVNVNKQDSIIDFKMD